MSVALGKKIFGGLLALAGINVTFKTYDAAFVTGTIMIVIGLGIISWGFRS